MNITAEKINVLENKVVVNIEPTDYAAKFEEAVKQYRKKVSMPGFRTGMVPVGMVRKMYGKALLYEELNKLVQDGINGYLEENKLDIFAQPMPDESNNPFGEELETDKDFNFIFNIGLKPEVNIDTPVEVFTRFKVEPSAEMMEDYLKDLRSRHFEGAYPEQAEAGDMVFLRIKELDENAEVKTDGMVTVSLVKLAEVADEALRNELTGTSKDYSTRTNLALIFGDDASKIAAGIKKTEEELSSIGREVEITVSNVMREGLAEMNEEFFAKVFGSEEIKTEADFMARIKLELGRSLEAEAERYLRNQLTEAFFKTDGIELPDEFLKRWLLTNAKNPIDQATLDTQYPEYAKQLRRDLLIDKVMEMNAIEIQGEDIVNQAKGLLYRQFSSYGIPMDDAMLQKYAIDYLQKDDNYTNIYYSLKYAKVEEYLLEKANIEEKPIAFEDFKKLTEQNAV
ncbi:MAG: trigger factor [Bacteroidia bacterium]